ncbi:sugar transferase [Rhodobacteraceae bacterium KMM 6894]|nr:sugar transferase [Rhodobacteraceae bacterium KMM 6894]
MNNNIPSKILPPSFRETRPELRLKPRWGILKPLFDKGFALTVLTVFSPVFLIVAAAIKLDSPGPIFFCQPRFGKDGRVIKVTKFRTMHHVVTDIGGKRQAVRNDARVTRLGAFLRRSCLDEIPQFWDVLCGRLSVVGPRPHPLEMEIENQRADLAIPNYHDRHRVRPGITGLAQVRGNCGPIETLEKGRARVAFDTEYIDKISFKTDIQIILATFGAVVFQNKTY